MLQTTTIRVIHHVPVAVSGVLPLERLNEFIELHGADNVQVHPSCRDDVDLSSLGYVFDEQPKVSGWHKWEKPGSNVAQNGTMASLNPDDLAEFIRKAKA